MTEPDSVDTELMLDQALGEYLRKLEQHEYLDPESIAVNYPEVSSQLRICIATMEEIQDMAGPTIAGQSQATASIDTAKANSVVEPTIVAERQPLATRVAQQLKPGELFGRYRVDRLLGKGAMGAVYLAYDEHLHREVALKIPMFAVDLEDELRERFYREARAAATLRSANICPVYDVNEVDGIHYISMAYIEGSTLSEAIRDQTVNHPQQVAELIRKLALALQKAHDRGIVHRDLKPGNVMLDSEGEPIVTDFGLARRLDDNTNLTQSGALVGSPSYMSPEQIDGNPEDVGPASDIYSLGVILYELLTGRPPFLGSMLSVIGQVSRDDPPPPSQVCRDIQPGSLLESVCLKMMAKRPADRFPTMSAVAEALWPLTKPPCGSNPDLKHKDITPACAKPLAIKPLPLRPENAKQSINNFRLIAVALLIIVLTTFAGLVVVVTDQGRIEIRSEVDDVRVVVEQNGEAVKMFDLKTGTELHWMPSGKYEFRPVGNDNKIEVINGGFELKRLGKAVVTVRLSQPTPQEAGNSRVLTTYDKPAVRVIFSPDGTRVASSSASGTILIHDTKTGRRVTAMQGHQGSVNSLAFSADGSRLLTGAWDKSIRLWDVESGEQLKEYLGHSGLIHSAVWSPDETRIASCTHEGNEGSIWIWDANSGDVLRQFDEVRFQPFMVAYSPDGTQLLSGAHDGQARLWDVTTGEELRRFQGHRDWVISVAFSSDGSKAVTASKDHTIRIWNVATGEERKTLAGHTNLVGTAVFSLDDQRVLSGSLDETIRLWDATTGSQLHKYSGHVGEVRRVAIATDGRLAASAGADGTVRLWSLPAIAENMKTRTAVNLKELGLALHMHLDTHKTFPAAIGQLRGGVPTKPYSWRVAILPFIGEQKLHDQYRFDQEWDSESNLKVLNKMPAVFRGSHANPNETKTPFLAIVGSETVIADHPVSIDDIQDGLSKTIMLIKTRKQIPWTKPEDIEYQSRVGMPELTPANSDGFQSVFADGAVHFLGVDTDEKTLRALITRNGKEQVEIP